MSFIYLVQNLCLLFGGFLSILGTLLIRIVDLI